MFGVCVTSFLLITVYIWIRYGYLYAKGMEIYAKFNNILPCFENRFTDPESCLDSVKTEFAELCEEVNKFNIYNIFLEFGDVVHACIKYVLVKCLPKQVYCHYMCWLTVFIVGFPALHVMIKLAVRYEKFGCIRNHSNPNNCKHTCDFKLCKLN